MEYPTEKVLVHASTAWVCDFMALIQYIGCYVQISETWKPDKSPYFNMTDVVAMEIPEEEQHNATCTKVDISKGWICMSLTAAHRKSEG